MMPIGARVNCLLGFILVPACLAQVVTAPPPSPAPSPPYTPTPPRSTAAAPAPVDAEVALGRIQSLVRRDPQGHLVPLTEPWEVAALRVNPWVTPAKWPRIDELLAVRQRG